MFVSVLSRSRPPGLPREQEEQHKQEADVVYTLMVCVCEHDVGEFINKWEVMRSGKMAVGRTVNCRDQPQVAVELCVSSIEDVCR